jgi:hypothetical protein
MAIIEVISDYNSGNAAYPVLYQDSAVDAGTKVVLDAIDRTTYPGAVLPSSALAASTSLVNFADSANPLTVIANIPGGVDANSGIKFNGDGQRILLPNTCKLGSGATHFGFGAWIKPGTPNITSGQYTSLAAYSTGGTGDTIQWAIQQAGASPNTWTGECGAAVGFVTVSNGEVAQIFFECIISGGTSQVKTYKNGALIGTGTPAGLVGGVFPTPATSAYIGQGTAYSKGPVVNVGRFLFEDFTVSGAMAAADFVANDYALNLGRFT